MTTPTSPTPPDAPHTNPNTNTNTGSGSQIHISTHASTAPAPSSPSSSTPARAAGFGTLFSGMAALILAAATLAGLTGGAAIQARTNVLPLGNPAPTVTATATVTTTATATTTVTAAPPAATDTADTAGATTSGALLTTNDGWLVFYRGTETVGYAGMNFGTKPPSPSTANFRIGGTDGGDPYIEPVYNHTIVRLTKTGTIGPKTCKSEATSHPSQYAFMRIQVGYSYCMYLQTGGNGKLAVLLTTLEVTNKSLETSTARFSVTIWSDPGE
ncbi:hypothetical protein [Streptomyces sp. NBC_01262]|uniref:hypothetical protein n=1 Tax=Streptomyces sp. NBC_01262 TaxID=2903803 RepID=UPI002E2EBF7C|nr:hypothetical protein [Streptomyces sp. NBC_01262]